MKFFAAGIVVVVIAWIAIARMLGAPAGEEEFVDFAVEAGQGVNEISAGLKDAGLIRSMFAFETIIWMRGAENQVQAGRYRLPRGYRLTRLIDTLLSGGTTEDSRVTLIEGWSNNEYAEHLMKHGFDADEFLELVADAGPWRSNYPVLSSVPSGASLEGYLYPDTYAVTADKNGELLVGKMLDNFDVKFSELESLIDQSAMTLHDVLILASIVEREVSNEQDRRMVADIFLKRLDANIGLQSDATINYLTHSGRSRSTAEDLAIDSPYNTYKYRGLPPGPIGNPSVESTRAVLQPIANDYFYFLTDPEGTVYYAEDFDGHQQNRALYLR